jgi:LPXTG-motif cell wall-anchored protein
MVGTDVEGQAATVTETNATHGTAVESNTGSAATAAGQETVGETVTETQQANETAQETSTEAAGAATASVAGGAGGVVTLPNTGGSPLGAEALLGALLAALGAALLRPREILKRLFR